MSFVDDYRSSTCTHKVAAGGDKLSEKWSKRDFGTFCLPFQLLSDMWKFSISICCLEVACIVVEWLLELFSESAETMENPSSKKMTSLRGLIVISRRHARQTQRISIAGNEFSHHQHKELHQPTCHRHGHQIRFQHRRRCQQKMLQPDRLIQGEEIVMRKIDFDVSQAAKEFSRCVFK